MGRSLAEARSRYTLMVTQHPEASPSTKVLLVHLAVRWTNRKIFETRGDLEAWPSQETLATALHVSEETVRRAVRDAEKCGLLAVEPSRGPGTSSKYRLVDTSHDDAPQSCGANGQQECGVSPHGNGEEPHDLEENTPQDRHPTSLKTSVEEPKPAPRIRAASEMYWELGEHLLVTRGGKSRAQARAFLGKAVSIAGSAEALWPALAQAEVNGTQDPASYLMKAAQRLGGQTQEEDEYARIRREMRALL